MAADPSTGTPSEAGDAVPPVHELVGDEHQDGLEAAGAQGSRSTTPFLVLSRSRILATAERGGLLARILFHIVPFWIDVVWVVLYFIERGQDVFDADGPCTPPYNGTSSPFFVTARVPAQWSVQLAFAMITAFVFAPVRLLRDRVPPNTISFAFEVLFDIITVLPFLVSVWYLPMYQLYVPTFLRAWTARVELRVLIGNKSLVARTTLFLGKILCLCITMMGLFEWAQNNFPVQTVVFSALRADMSSTLSYPCITFTESLYFFVVTFATVGYGDIVPTNDLARMIVTFSILVFLILLPAMIQQLTSIIESSGDATTIAYKAKHNHKHVVISGKLSPSTLRQWMAATPSRYRATLVCVTGEEASPVLRRLVRGQSHGVQVVFLQSKLHSLRELERCGVHTAEAHVILPSAGDGSAPGEGTTVDLGRHNLERDRDSLSRAWASQAFFPNTPTRVMLHAAVNASRTFAPPMACTVELGLDDWTQRVAAANILVPGLSTLVSFLCFGGCGDATQSHAELEEAWEGDWEDDVEELERARQHQREMRREHRRQAQWKQGGGSESLPRRIRKTPSPSDGGSGGGGGAEDENDDILLGDSNDAWLWSDDMLYLDSMRKSLRRVCLSGMEDVSMRLSDVCQFFARSSILVLGMVGEGHEPVLDGQAVVRRGHDLIVFATSRAAHLVETFTAWDELAATLASRNVAPPPPPHHTRSITTLLSATGAVLDLDDLPTPSPPPAAGTGAEPGGMAAATTRVIRVWIGEVFFRALEHDINLKDHVIVIPNVNNDADDDVFFSWYYAVQHLLLASARDSHGGPDGDDGTTTSPTILVMLPGKGDLDEGRVWNRFVSRITALGLPPTIMDHVHFTTGLGFREKDLVRVCLHRARAVMLLGHHFVAESDMEHVTPLDKDFYTLLAYRTIQTMVLRDHLVNLQVFVSFSSLETMTYFSLSQDDEKDPSRNGELSPATHKVGYGTGRSAAPVLSRPRIGGQLNKHWDHWLVRYAPSFVVKSCLLSTSTHVSDTTHSQRAAKLVRLAKLYPKLVNGCDNPMFAEGTFWAPEILNFLLVASVFKGAWVPELIRRILAQAGSRIVLLRVQPEWVRPSLIRDGDGVRYGDVCRVVCERAKVVVAGGGAGGGGGGGELRPYNVWGVFRNYYASSSVPVQAGVGTPQLFRGVLLSPHRSLLVSLVRDRVFVCT